MPKGQRAKANVKKVRQSKVDQFLSTLPEDDIDDLMDLCSFNANVNTLILALKERGYQGSPMSVYRWYHRKFPESTTAQRINKQVRDYDRIDQRRMINMHMVRAHELLDRLERQALDAQIRDDQALMAIAPLYREVRTLISSANELKYIDDMRMIGMSYVDRCCRDIELQFQDKPQEAIVKEAVRVVWQRIAEEEGW